VSVLFQVQAAHYNKVSKLAKLLNDFKNIKFYDITGILCPNGTCAMRPEKDIIMYIDTGHLSAKGAEYVLKKINLSLL
jgi:lysophospholipase L1-like esterase